MDYYQNRIKALKTIEDVVTREKSTDLEALFYMISLEFGFSERFVLNFLEKLEKQEKIKVEKSTIINLKNEKTDTN